jgi:hypothetical protein
LWKPSLSRKGAEKHDDWRKASTYVAGPCNPEGGSMAKSIGRTAHLPALGIFHEGNFWAETLCNPNYLEAFPK